MTRETRLEVGSDIGPWSLVPAWVLDAGLSDGAVRLYAVLASYANYNTGNCWPSNRTLADRCGCSKDTILRRRLELVKVGAITTRRRSTHTTLVTVNVRKS